VLYAAACLLAVGNGGTRYNTATLGADQFAYGDERRRHGRDAFFSCYFVFLYASYVAGDTALVYVQDSVSWALGFVACAATTGLGLVALVAGSRYYRRPVPRGSPFTALARVVVAAARKATLGLGPTSTSTVQYYHHGGSSSSSSRDDPPSNRFKYTLFPGDSYEF
jgi:peptide/histidine transporter 3/4